MVNAIKNLKIRAKLYILVGVALIGMLAIGIISFILMNRLNEPVGYIVETLQPKINLSRNMEETVFDIRMSEFTYLSSSDKDQRNSSLQSIKTDSSELEALIAEYTSLATTDTEKSAAEAISQSWNTYKKLDAQVQELIDDKKAEEALEILNGDALTAYKALMSAYDEIDAFNDSIQDESYVGSNRLYQTAMIALSVVMALVIVIGIMFAVVVIRGIQRPIAEIEVAATKMAQGDLDVEIQYKSKDELGQLAEQIRELVRKLGVIIDDENKFLAKMASGDFTVDTQCEAEYIGGFHPLLVSFRMIANQMNDTVAQITESAEQVANGSEQVSNGAQALSQGATEQASSVEELAATINEISTKVKETAENTQQANSMANAVGEEINSSNTKMNDMIQAMDDISNSSTEIGKIIKTIEDIAFQTNILALNAAVEAARAGSAGKGFAVVADEVRNLASKSAEASKNTAALIENSIKAVENGTRIAAETASSLNHVVESAKEITAVIDKISEASSNQASAISQVTLGIDQISSVVQTNSATAQESAAASEELSSQSQLMKNLVEKFKLKGHEGIHMASSPKPARSSYSSSRSSYTPSYESAGAYNSSMDKY